MDLTTMKLLEDRLNIPLDLLIYIESFMFQKINDHNIKEAISLWFSNKLECEWKYGHISNWNVSKVTDMRNIFANRDNFNEDISKWDVSNVRNMKGMFFRARSFNCDLSKWNVGKVTNMASMFNGASEFNSDLSQWNVSNVNDMDNMFYRARKFNCNLNNWNIHHVRRMDDFLFGAISFDLTNIQQWNLNDIFMKKILGYIILPNKPNVFY